MPVIPVSVWCQLPHPPLAWTPPSVALAQSCLHSLQSPISDRQTAVWCSLSTAEAVLPAGKATEGQRGSCIERLPGPFLPVALRGQVGPPSQPCTSLIPSKLAVAFLGSLLLCCR